MFELRWLIDNNWSDPNNEGPKRVLQFRIKRDPSVREGSININVGRFNPYLEWSEWMDVPEVHNETLDIPRTCNA